MKRKAAKILPFKDCSLLYTHLITTIGLTEIQTYCHSLEKSQNIWDECPVQISASFLMLLNGTMKMLYQAEILHMKDIENPKHERDKFSILQRGKIHPTASQSVHLCCAWSGGHIKWRRCSTLCTDPSRASPLSLPFPIWMVGLGYRRLLLCRTFYFSVQNSHRSSQRLQYHGTQVLQNELLPATTPWAFFFFMVASQPWRETCIFAFLEQNRVKEKALMLGKKTHHINVSQYFSHCTQHMIRNLASTTERNHWRNVRVFVMSSHSITAICTQTLLKLSLHYINLSSI